MQTIFLSFPVRTAPKEVTYFVNPSTLIAYVFHVESQCSQIKGTRWKLLEPKLSNNYFNFKAIKKMYPKFSWTNWPECPSLFKSIYQLIASLKSSWNSLFDYLSSSESYSNKFDQFFGSHFYCLKFHPFHESFVRLLTTYSNARAQVIITVDSRRILSTTNRTHSPGS